MARYCSRAPSSPVGRQAACPTAPTLPATSPGRSSRQPPGRELLAEPLEGLDHVDGVDRSLNSRLWPRTLIHVLKFTFVENAGISIDPGADRGRDEERLCLCTAAVAQRTR